jgi:Heliorhodopsin
MVDSGPWAPDPQTAERYRRLRIANVVVGLVMAAQALAVVVLGNSLSLPVFASYLRTDPVEAQRAAPATELFSVGIAAAVAVFLALAALDHFVVAAPRVHRWYERNLGRHVNYARWIEYSLSASIMIVLVAMFTGIRDIAALIAIFGVNTAMILFGLLMERQQEPGSADWSAFWFGSFAGVVPWIAVAIYLFGGPNRPPGFVYAITVVELVLFFSFAVNMVLQYLRIGRWRDYLVGERSYLLLSLTAKSLLAWLIFANVLRS